MATLTVIDHTEVASGGAAYWEETSISQSYDHLMLQASVRTTDSGSGTTETFLRLNGHTNYIQYTSTVLYGPSGPYTTRSSNASGEAWHRAGYLPKAGELADTFSAVTIWFINYTGTIGYKQNVLEARVQYNNASPWIGMWNSAIQFAVTDAIDELKYWPMAGSFAEHSTITLYGITGA